MYSARCVARLSCAPGTGLRVQAIGDGSRIRDRGKDTTSWHARKSLHQTEAGPALAGGAGAAPNRRTRKSASHSANLRCQLRNDNES